MRFQPSFAVALVPAALGLFDIRREFDGYSGFTSAITGTS